MLVFLCLGYSGIYEGVGIPVTRTTLADMIDKVLVCMNVEWMDVLFSFSDYGSLSLSYKVSSSTFISTQLSNPSVP